MNGADDHEFDMGRLSIKTPFGCHHLMSCGAMTGGWCRHLDPIRSLSKQGVELQRMHNNLTLLLEEDLVWIRSQTELVDSVKHHPL